MPQQVRLLHEKFLSSLINSLTIHAVEQSNVEIRDCDQGVSHCARQFKKVITVHEYNTTVANIRWHEVTTVS